MDLRPPNPLFGSFSFSNYLADSQSTPSAFAQYISQQSQNHQPQKKKGSEKERNPNWSKQEDEALCNAWLRISEDAATGTDQSRAKLWDRIWNEFNCILGYQTERTSTHLMNRWTVIQSRLNKYSGFVRTVERTPTSGYNVEDSIGAVDALYYNSEGHHFKFHGCWMLLKDSSKWFNYSQEKDKRKEKITERKRHEGDGNVDSPHPSTPARPTSTAGLINLDDEISPVGDEAPELPRPAGRTITKKARRNKNVGSDSANLFIEQFDNLRKDQKEMAEQEISMANERERLKIEAKREKEQNRHETQIMMVDPNLIPTEEGRAWFIAKQKAILARTMLQGSVDRSSGSQT